MEPKERFKDLPEIKTYIPYIIFVAAIASLFPIFTCLQFPTTDIGPETCLLTWQQRATQSGILITYVSVIIGFYNLYWDKSIEKNKSIALNHLEIRKSWKINKNNASARMDEVDNEIKYLEKKSKKLRVQ